MATQARTIARILKVNHAGEYGAIRIYRAQLSLSRRLHPELVSFLSGTLAHEEDHCRRFREAMPQHKARPCAAMWLWGIGGTLLGAVTALMSANAVLACTKAVEQTVHQHLDEQLRYLTDKAGDLYDMIADIRVEELAHLDFAARNLEPSWLNAPLEAVIAVATEAVIWLSTQGAVSRMKRALAEDA